MPVGPDAPAGQHERGPGLDDVEGAVLAPVAAPVLVVVGGAVDHAQVGRHRRLEELRHLLVAVGVGVGRLCAGSGPAASASAPAKRPQYWSPSGLRPATSSTS